MFSDRLVRYFRTVLTDTNPFIYSHPIAPDDVVDRDAETGQLLAAAVGGHFVRLYAPRKYGKTSLLRRVLRDAERRERMIPILVDLYGVLSIADVAIRFERAYARQLKGRARARIEEFLQTTGLGLSLGALGISARLQVEPRTDPLPAPPSSSRSGRSRRAAPSARSSSWTNSRTSPGSRGWTRSCAATSSSRAR